MRGSSESSISLSLMISPLFCQVRSRPINPIQPTRILFPLLLPHYNYHFGFYKHDLTDGRFSMKEIVELFDLIYKVSGKFFEYKDFVNRIYKLVLTFLVTSALAALSVFTITQKTVNDHLDLNKEEIIILTSLLLLFVLSFLVIILLFYFLGKKDCLESVQEAVQKVLDYKNAEIKDRDIVFMLEEAPVWGVFGGIALLLNYKEKPQQGQNSPLLPRGHRNSALVHISLISENLDNTINSVPSKSQLPDLDRVNTSEFPMLK